MENDKKFFGINVSCIRYYFIQKNSNYEYIEIIWIRNTSDGNNLKLKLKKGYEKELKNKFINCIANSVNLNNAFINLTTDNDWFIYDMSLSTINKLNI